MKNMDFSYRSREHHPRVSIGIFFIVLGIALLLATKDVLHLGSISSYFNWKTLMIFIGVLLILNLEFIGGILLVAGGIWFMQEQIFPLAHESFEIFFWPAVIGSVGISFILSSFIKKKNLK